MKRPIFVMLVAAMSLVIGTANAAVTEAQCHEFFDSYGDRPCTGFTVREETGYTLCLCNGCELEYDGYYYFPVARTVVGGSLGTVVRTFSVCKKGQAVGNQLPTGSVSTCPTDSVECTTCKGPSATNGGRLWCGMWKSGIKTGNPSSLGPNVTAVFMATHCCTSDGYAADRGETQPFIMGCTAGMMTTDSKRECICSKGYYGTPSSGCTACPTSGGRAGTTLGPGTEEVGGCFISGLTDSDENGYWICVSDAWYE